MPSIKRVPVAGGFGLGRCTVSFSQIPAASCIISHNCTEMQMAKWRSLAIRRDSLGCLIKSRLLQLELSG